MVGDIVGYSAMMEKSEEKTIARLATCQTLIAEKVAALVTIGDAHLPRDVTSAVSHAARLMDGLANSPSNASGVSGAGASAMSSP